MEKCLGHHDLASRVVAGELDYAAADRRWWRRSYQYN
jgi:hypothetical protein